MLHGDVPLGLLNLGIWGIGKMDKPKSTHPHNDCVYYRYRLRPVRTRSLVGLKSLSDRCSSSYGISHSKDIASVGSSRFQPHLYAAILTNHVHLQRQIIEIMYGSVMISVSLVFLSCCYFGSFQYLLALNWLIDDVLGVKSSQVALKGRKFAKSH
jgi:hypothetical protein